MIRKLAMVLASAMLAACSATPTAPETPSISIADYQRAESFLPKNVRKKIRNLAVEPNWINNSSNFWFSEVDPEGNNTYYKVEPATAKVSLLFDHQQLKTSVKHDESTNFYLKINAIDVDNNQLSMRYGKQDYQCSLLTSVCDKPDKADTPSQASYSSPDGNYALGVKDWNLFLTDNRSNSISQLTFDGTEGYPYAVQNQNPKAYINKDPAKVKQRLSVYWAPDSKTVLTHRMNREKVGKLHLIQSSHNEGLRPKLYSYYYPLAGDEHLPTGDIYSVDVASKEVTKVVAPELQQTYYGGPLWGWWEDNNRFYFFEQARAKKRISFHEYNPENHQVRLIVEEKSDKFLDPWAQDAWVLPETNEVIWPSQRSGKQQYYLYDLASGKLKNKITQCDCFVRTYRALDKKTRTLYYEASGGFDDRDPYLRHLYKVNLDGTGHQLLTPEALEHSARIAPDFSYFVDISSTVQSVPTTKVRSTIDGKVVMTVGNPDVSELMAIGWRAPEPFEVLANDNKTKLYGLMYKPSNFDASKQYPVIDATYTGPHNFFTPKSFWSYFQQAQSLAELGFVVIKMDGRGTSKRNRDFHLVAYENLAAGVDDHVQAIKDLARKHSYLDVSRVGIYGFSAGGYDTAQAMFRHADFFKVGVAASGNHDFRVDKTGWNEIWLGYPVAKHWDEQTNLNMDSIAKLKGKLLLAHGELDENVNPAATMQLVDKLIKANKDFDLMIYPNRDHFLNDSDYFVRKRWDYFVEHLLGAKPVKEYQFEQN
ncbi:S9 family peptidase [Shewanella kaireitica]|uniref:S9 family peptidase n=1 Tax=Shewanella kaireitica TaxID=212021 RepID=UPI00200EA8E6|nr:DPP IV N-terminal domain-containing protein [Shewanella kaireitica]MCL1092233.1 prolyl oligopeptidase family serine peptidase [Shewanella kaireitica]